MTPAQRLMVILAVLASATILAAAWILREPSAPPAAGTRDTPMTVITHDESDTKSRCPPNRVCGYDPDR